MRPPWSIRSLAVLAGAAAIQMLVMLAAPGEARACSCAPITRSQALRAADVAFRGRVLEVDPPRRTGEPPPVERALLRVLAGYKEADPPVDRWISYSTDGAGCGFGAMWPGAVYDVYAVRGPGGALSIHLCGGSRRIPEDAAPPGCTRCGASGGSATGAAALLLLAAVRLRRRRTDRGGGAVCRWRWHRPNPVARAVAAVGTPPRQRSKRWRSERLASAPDRVA